MDKLDERCMSRRTLLRGMRQALVSAGTMALLPRVDGGYLMPVAYAQESVGVLGDASYTFHVVAPDEVGIHVVDVSNVTASGDFAPVKGATVTITSHFNQAQVSGDTDSEGKVYLSLRELTVTDPDDPTLPLDGTFQCNARIEVDTSHSRSKMRNFATELEVLVGQNGYVIGTHALLATDATYIKSLLFDRWDIHNVERTWYRSIENQVEHKFTVAIEGVTADVEVSLDIYQRDDEGKPGSQVIPQMKATATYDVQTKLATATLSGHFLELGHSQCLTEDHLLVSVGYAWSGQTFTTSVRMNTEEAPLDNALLNASFAPILKGAGDLFSFSATGDWPCFNGLTLSFWDPAFPLQIYPSWNLVLIGIGCDFRLKDDDGFTPGDYFEEDHKDNLIKRGKAKWDDLKDKYDTGRQDSKTTKQPFKDKDGNATSHTALGFLHVSIIAHVIAGIQYTGFKDTSARTKKFEGDVYVSAGIDVSGGVVWKFMVGSIPFFISLSGGLQAVFGYGLIISKELLKEEKSLDATDLVWSQDGSYSINLKPWANLTGGAGFKGVASIGISATVAFPIYIGWGQYKPSSNLSDTHVNVSLTFRLEIAFQFLLIKGSVLVWAYQKNDWYDNWKGKSLEEGDALTGLDAFGDLSPRFMLSHPGEDGLRHTLVMGKGGVVLQGNAADPFADLIVLDNDELDQTKEALARGANEIEPLYDASQVALRRGAAPLVTVADDGTVSVELVPSDAMNTFVYGEEPLEAEAEPAFETQPDDALTLGDAFFGFARPVGAEYDYDYDIYSKTTGAMCAPGGVKRIAAHNGIAPTVDVVVYEGVFSDPRQKIVEIGGVPYLFRIMTVVYPTSTGTLYRSRVVASSFDRDESGGGSWGKPKVIEYSSLRSDLPRVDIFDYDFDIVTRSSTSTWVQGSEACLVVTGGLRPEGSDVYDVFANPTVSVVLLNANLRVVQCTVNHATSLYGGDRFHSVMTPRIVDGFAAGGASGALGIVFLHRSSADKKGLLAVSPDATTSAFALGYCFVRDSYLAFALHAEDDTQIGFDVQDVRLAAADGIMRIVFTKQEGYEAWSATIPEGGTFDDVVVRRNIVSDEVLPEIQPWPGHGTFLFVKNRPEGDATDNDYHLYEGSYDIEATQDSLSATQVDSANIKSGTFCISPSGHFLLYYETFEGNPGDDFDPDTGERTPCSDKIYRIMASKYQDGAFTEEFPFVELDEPIDHLRPLSFGSDASSFLATHITDFDQSISDMRYIAVPHTIAVEAEGFGMKDDFAFPGTPCNFQLDVRNHGNMIIDGFDVELHDDDRGGMLVQTVSVRPIDPAKILLNASSRNWAEGLHSSGLAAQEEDAQQSLLRLSAAEEGGLFVPGKLLSYVVTFDIPADWTGDKHVTVRVVNATTPGIDELGMRVVNTTLPDADGYGVDVARHFASTITMVDDASASATLYDPYESVTTDEGSGGGASGGEIVPSGGGSSGGSASGSASSTHGRRLPDTGDLTSALAPAGFVLGGLTAALGAYSQRRVQVERERQESESGE